MSEDVTNRRVATLSNGIEVWELNITTIKEQDINAQVMDDRKMKILTSNIKERGALESLPYIYKDGDTFRIISGHHRVRAANDAGMKSIYALVETNTLTKSQITSKQIAHNELVGEADKEILSQLIKQMNDVDDMIASGLPDELLNTVLAENQTINIPQLTFDWRIVNLTFLPNQLQNFDTLARMVDNKAEEVGLVDRQLYDGFCNALSKLGKVKKVTSMSTVVALLTDIALREVEKCQQEDTANT